MGATQALAWAIAASSDAVEKLYLFSLALCFTGIAEIKDVLGLLNHDAMALGGWRANAKHKVRVLYFWP